MPVFANANDPSFQNVIDPNRHANDTILTPVNMLVNPDRNDRRIIGARISDDNFFHLTCHIDPALEQKIQKGVMLI